MNLAHKHLFNFLSRHSLSATTANAAGFLRLHNGCPNMAEAEVKSETKVPVSRVSSTAAAKVDMYEPDKLYKSIELEMRANQRQLLNSYEKFVSMAAEGLGVEIGRVWGPKSPHHERYTVLRSAFVHKRCRVQYEFRTYFRYMNFLKLTGSTADTFLEYIERNLPEGLALKVTKVAVEAVPEHLVPEKTDVVEGGST